MKTLHINKGYTLDTDDGYMVITGKHFGDFAATDYVVDDDGNATENGTVILTAADIKSKQHDMTGEAFDFVEYDVEEGTNMKYTIKPEYLTLWGEDANEETMLTEDDIEMIARGWDKDVEDVIDQLEPYNFDSAVELMDDDLREEIHAELAPCSDARFLWEYCKRHQEKFGEAFTI